MNDQGIGSWVRKRRLKSGDRVAVRFEGRDLSYRSLATRVARLANVLAESGIEFGDRVAYLGENHPSFLETLFATAQLGAVFVPLNTRLAPSEIQFVLEDSGSRLLIHSESLAQTATTASDGTAVERLIPVSQSGSAGDAPAQFEDLVSAGSSDDVPRAVSLEDTAMILYTSGTTGRPKGAVLTHANLTWNAFNVLIDYDVASTDRALMVSPLFHVAALGMGTLPAILKGATVVLERRFDADRALALIEDERITWMSGVPTTFQMLCESDTWKTTKLDSLRILTCGGSPVPGAVIDAFERRGLAFTGGYGMTEASPGVTSLGADTDRSKSGSSGLPHFFVDVRVAAEDGEELGEIEARGANVMKRYWNRPSESDAAFRDEEWFRTGDLGYFDEDGYLYVSDRLKDMIISGGENIYPAEVELVIAELASVADVAVIGVPDERWGEVPVAVVAVTTTRAEAELELEIREYLDGRLARYKIPKRVFIIDELPRTATGKVVKARLRERYAAISNAGP